MVNQAQLYKQVNKGQIENGEALLKYADPKPGELVLDIGCGTGELTFQLAKKIESTGRIIGLDPDADRIQIAQQSQPQNLKNITWMNNYFTGEVIPPKPTFDLIFSNYVFHWLEHKEEGVSLTADCLKPGGRFAIQFIYGFPECLRLIREMVDKPFKFPPNLREQWLSYFDKHGLKYEIKSDVIPYYHPNIDDLLEWFEATTHGVVKRADLSSAQITLLHQKYPGELSLDHPTLRLIGFKPK